MCFGGTLFEKFYSECGLDRYIKFLNDVGVSLVEVSCGTIDIPLEHRLEIVKDLRRQQFNVLAEVGSKDSDEIMAPSVWISEMKQLLDAGCDYVITEGRDSASAGLYRANGEIRTGLLSDMLDSIDFNKIIFEAPTSASQMYFINTVGVNVNLGNVSPRDLLILEAQRTGLRCETFLIDK